jgi:hypothetical protein
MRSRQAAPFGRSSYIDAMVLRDRDADELWDAASDGVLEQRHYLCQNWRNDTALVATDAGALVENVKFSGYGNSFNAPAGDVNSDGAWDSTDAGLIGGGGGYDVNKDIDMDGSVGAGDLTAADAVTGGYHTEGRGVLSAEEVFIRKGYAGYELDPVLTGSDGIAFLHHVRHRVLSSYTGRWNTRPDAASMPNAANIYVIRPDSVVQEQVLSMAHLATCADGDPSTPTGCSGTCESGKQCMRVFNYGNFRCRCRGSCDIESKVCYGSDGISCKGSCSTAGCPKGTPTFKCTQAGSGNTVCRCEAQSSGSAVNTLMINSSSIE